MLEDRLRILKDADRTGRAMILPCKLGEAFYRVISKDYDAFSHVDVNRKPRHVRSHVVKCCILSETNAYKAAKDFGTSVFRSFDEAEKEKIRREKTDELCRNIAVS